jgi:DNA-3-methyladenine glycosylase II
MLKKPKANSFIEIVNGIKALKTKDQVISKIIDDVGPYTLKPEKQYFKVLAESIVYQQLSIKAAETIFKRLIKLVGGHTNLRPENVITLSNEQLRSAGLSSQKSKYLKDLAEKFLEKEIIPIQLSKMTDEEVIALLSKVKGIGRWTAEMFLIFSLGRSNILPIADLGFRRAVEVNYKIRKPVSEKKILELSKKWEPYRSIAVWYLWKSLEKSEKKLPENE